jgi:50S ribosomal subunit-associated GTPase HflX
MNATSVTVPGVVKPDGSLELEGKVPLPPGKVQVTVQAVPELPKDDPFWQMMEAIWAGQQARGHRPRSVEEVEAERRQVREEWEERMQEIERVQAEARRLRGLSE